MTLPSPLPPHFHAHHHCHQHTRHFTRVRRTRPSSSSIPTLEPSTPLHHPPPTTTTHSTESPKINLVTVSRLHHRSSPNPSTNPSSWFYRSRSRFLSLLLVALLAFCTVMTAVQGEEVPPAGADDDNVVNGQYTRMEKKAHLHVHRPNVNNTQRFEVVLCSFPTPALLMV